MRYNTLRIATLLGVLGGCTDEWTSPTRVTDLGPLGSAAATPAMRTEFEGFVNFCESASPDKLIVTPGGTLHLHGVGNRNQWVTGNSLIDGFEENAVLLNLNLKNGTGTAQLDVTLEPDAVNGTWEIRQTVKVVDFAPAGSKGVGHGTGELQGMTIKFTTLPPAGGASLCNPEMGRGAVHGVVIAPASPG